MMFIDGDNLRLTPNERSSLGMLVRGPFPKIKTRGQFEKILNDEIAAYSLGDTPEERLAVGILKQWLKKANGEQEPPFSVQVAQGGEYTVERETGA